MKDRLQAAQKELEATVQAKQEEINDLDDQLWKQIIETKEEQEKIFEELDLYIQMHEETSADYLAKIEMEKEELTKNYNKLAKRYEHKCLARLVVEAKIQRDQELAANRLHQLKKECFALKYQHTMGDHKIRHILTRHMQRMRQMITDLLDNGWKTWSNQAAELQLLRADHENRKTQGQGFFKLDETSITMVQEELANDIYKLIVHHKTEINQLLEEFDDQQIETMVELNSYEKGQRRQEGEQEENEDVESDKEESGQSVPLNESQQEEEQQGVEQAEAESTQQSEQEQHTQEQVAPDNTEDQEDDERTLLDIPTDDDDEEYIQEDNLHGGIPEDEGNEEDNQV